MASRDLGLKGNEIVQSVLKRNPLSSPVKDGDNNTNDVVLRSKNVETEAENSFSSSLLAPLKSRTSVVETAPTPPTSAPFGPTILDKLITKNKLQSMKEAELRKDKTNEGASSTQEMKPIDPQILKKRKMIANRLRNPFVTKRRKRFKRKQSEGTNQDASKQKNRLPGTSRLGSNANSPNAKKRPVNAKDTKTDSRIAANRVRRRLNSDSSAPSPTKKTLLNKSNRPVKSKLSNVEALKQSSKLGRNNRYSTRSDSPVLRNGKRRKCDEISFDLYDIDKKRKRLTNDLASVKSDGMSDEQCSYVTASESDVCSFLDLETSSQNLDVKEESCDSTFKLEVPTSPSIDGDDVNSNLINLESPFKGISSLSGAPVKKERCSVEEDSVIPGTQESKFDTDLKDENSGVQDGIKEEKLSSEIEKDEEINDAVEAKEETDNLISKKDEEFDEECLLNSTCEEKADVVSTLLDSSNETVLLEDSSVSENSVCIIADSGEKNEIDSSTSSTIPQTSSQEVCQGRKFRSSSLNDSSKKDKVSFPEFAALKVDEEEHKASDSDEPSFTTDNSQFELFVEREYKRGRKKRSSSDTSLQRLQNISKGSDIKLKSFLPISEDEKSSDANGAFSDEKENEFYEKYITEESNSEEASCSSSQVSEHPKLLDKEFSTLEDLECKDDKEVRENDQQQVSENKQDEVASNCDGEKTTSDTPESQAMKESILTALGLQSASMQAAAKVKPKDKYTGTLKAVIKLNRTADKKSPAGRMVFKQKDTSNVGSKNLEYRICSELAPGSENVPLTHLKDIAVNNLSKKSHLKPKSHFDLSGPLNEVDLEVAQVKKQEEPADGSAPKEEEVKKALVIPEKSSSFSIHPERLCSDVCSYCHGKFGSLDTPCHIGQIKNSERRSKILSIEILLTKDSCLCDACFRYVDRRANCPSFKAQAPKPQRRQPLSDAVCSVQGCGQPANHSVRRKWIVKLKKSIAKKLMIDMEKIQHNQHLPFPLCSQHYYWVDYFTVCGICKKRLSRNNMYALGPEAEELNQFLHEDGIPVHLTDKLFLCKLCRYYSSLRLKYKDLSLMTPGHKTYFRSYRRKILQYHDIEVSESEEDAGGKSGEDESAENHSQGKVKRRKSKKSASDESKKSTSEEKLRQNLACAQGYSFDSLEGHQNEPTTPTIDYSALGDTGDVGFNNIASFLGAGEQPEISGNQARIQVKFGNLNIGKLANLNIGQDARSNSERVQRPPYLPGEQELPLKADISFQSGSKSSAWERCVSTIQFDKDTKQLWQELQRPYGNASSFMRHLVMLEKHWRSGSLVLVDNADQRAVKYVNSVRNRVDSFERNFKTPSMSSSSFSKSPSPAPRSDTPVPANVPKAPETPDAPSASKPSDSSDKCDKLENKSDTPQVPPVPSAAFPSTSTALPNTAFSCTSTVLPNTTFSSTPLSSASTTLSSTASFSNSITVLPSTAFSNTAVSSTMQSEPLCNVTKTSMIGPSTSANINSNIVTSPLIQCLNSPSSIPVVNLVNLNSNISNSSVSLSRSSTTPNVSYASLASVPLTSSPSVSLILPPNLSTSLPSSLQNTLINFTSDRNNLSLNQFSAPNISLSPSPSLSLKSSPHVSIAPKLNPSRQGQPPLKGPGAISKLLTGNKSAVSSPSSISNNPQFRKSIPHTPIDPSLFNKVRKQNPNQAQRQIPKLPPQLLRFSGPATKANVPPLELIVPKSFTMQTKTIPAPSAQPLSTRPRTPAPTQGIMDNLALLRQFRSLKPKPPDPKHQSMASFSPMICDVRSLASSEVNNSRMKASSGSMPKIPKALTITQVSQTPSLPRSVTVSLEKKSNQIPAAFLGGEKPSVSVFCEVNPPP